MTPQSQSTLDVFFSYAHQDEALRDQLQAHLAVLERQGLIRTWHDRRIGAGQDWAGEIDAKLDAADLVLLLVSPDFVASDYCWDVETRRALERHAARQALVIPVVLRPVDFAGAPFGRLRALPADGRPVTIWDDRDQAFRDVARGLRRLIEEELKRRAGEARRTREGFGGAAPPVPRPRRHPPPKLPERPYPVLLPYTHPALLGGRERDLAALRQRLRQPIPILGLYAPSGTGKSSLLLGGLVPGLRWQRLPVAVARHPLEGGLARRLLGDLVEGDGAAVDDGDWQGFVERLCAVESRTGKTPILIVDQFEDLLRCTDAGPARASLGVLLAATVRHRPAPPCRWLLSYREEYHGETVAWLRDVLAEARARGLGGIDVLPHDLAAPDRFHARSLAPLGAPLPGTDPLSEATEAFLAAIEAPVRLRSKGGVPRYPWRFAPGSAERLARAFAEARVARPEAPLTPELQVVLAHLLARSGGGDVTTGGMLWLGDDVEVPEDPGSLIDEALEDHLRRALEATFPAGRTGAEQRRARALLALRELAAASEERDESLSAKQLARAIGDDGEEILEQLATPLTRLVVAHDAPDGLRYALSHDRMAEAVVRVVEAEGQLSKLPVDAELLRLRRFVALETALHRSGEEPAPRLSRRRFERIAANVEALLWDDERRAWWSACRRRRRADRRRAVSWTVMSVAALALVAFGVWSWATARAQRRTLLEQVAQGEPEVALQALDRLRQEDVGAGELLPRLRQRQVPSAVLERGLGGLALARRGAAVLAVVELLLPLVEETPDGRTPEDPVLIANLVSALDFAPARDPAFAALARELRDRVLAPLRRQFPPPSLPGPRDPDWIEIPAGHFFMGTGEEEEGQADERPRHEVAVSAFRLQRHEVTNGELRRLVPDHRGEENLPAAFISWYQAVTYAAWLGGRLPTEAEWEYAARAGCAHRCCDAEGRETTLDAVAWTLRNSRAAETGELAPRPVMRLAPNPWGLHDMLGNLWEWTADWYDGYSSKPRDDPWGPAAPGDDRRVHRGGSFRYETDRTRVVDRSRNAPGIEAGDQGFRVALPVDDAQCL